MYFYIEINKIFLNNWNSKKTGFDDSPFVNDNDFVDIPEGAQSVGNDNCSPAFGSDLQRLLDLHLGVGIECRRGLVQKQDFRIRIKGPFSD
jgi:hypothetical protein